MKGSSESCAYCLLCLLLNFITPSFVCFSTFYLTLGVWDHTMSCQGLNLALRHAKHTCWPFESSPCFPNHNTFFVCVWFGDHIQQCSAATPSLVLVNYACYTQRTMQWEDQSQPFCMQTLCSSSLACLLSPFYICQ